MKFTDYLSKNPVGGGTPEEHYDEQYVINTLTEQADLNLKYGPLFADQSKRTKTKMKLHNNTTEIQNEAEKDQQMNGPSENTQNVNKNEQNEITTSGQSEISTPKFSCKSTTEMKDNEIFYHWGATREIMEIIRRRNKSPEREGWWSKGTHYPDRAHGDADMTTKAKGHLSHHPDQIKEAEKNMPKSMRN